MNNLLSLKEAFRYSKHLSGLIGDIEKELIYYDRFDDLISETTEEHLKSKSNPDAKDEIEIITSGKEDFKNAKIEDVIELLFELRNEKIKVMSAITEAKKDIYIEHNGLKMDIDTAIQFNFINRNYIQRIISEILTVEDKVIKGMDTGLMLNEEKNQVPYSYPKVTTIKPKFDRTELEKRKVDVLEESDIISRKIDEANSKRCVNIDAKYSVYDTLNTLL